MSDQNRIQFLAYQKPALESGKYSIQVQQVVDVEGCNKPIQSKPLHFAVTGERFSLDPAAIHTVYPPAGSLGRYSDCLPHISIKRSTFPWERSAYGNEDYEPWLVLLLFDEQEIKEGHVSSVKTISLKELKNGNAKFPTMAFEAGQKEDDRIKVIEVKKDLLQDIIPSGDELKLMGHVRRRVDSDENEPETELAVLMTNRLPKEGSGSTMHLLSVEGRYLEDKTFDFEGATADDYIRLISLKSWSFSSLPEEGKDFEELIQELDSNLLRISEEPYLAHGYTALQHTLRQSDKTYSWYHGPLCANHEASKFLSDNDLPTFSDVLTRYHQDIGMFDISYAAAFELGRTLTIENTLISAAFYQWKHQYNEKICQVQEQVNTQKLTGTIVVLNDSQESKLENTIKNWFCQLSLLNEVPFNYLVADEKMLPPESIRFFNIDEHWMECMMYGAFTIGGNIRKMSEEDNSRLKCFKELTSELSKSDKSGFILRSQLVADYPDLMVDAYSSIVDHEKIMTHSESVTKLEKLRLERLGPEVLICLFQGKGNISTAELYLKPEGLHFGLDEELADDGKNMKYEKNISKKSNQETYDVITVPLKNLLKDKNKRVINIKSKNGKGLADQIAEELELEKIDSAQFGMQMIEGSNKGRFTRNKNHKTTNSN